MFLIIIRNKFTFFFFFIIKYIPREWWLSWMSRKGHHHHVVDAILDVVVLTTCFHFRIKNKMFWKRMLSSFFTRKVIFGVIRFKSHLFISWYKIQKLVYRYIVMWKTILIFNPTCMFKYLIDRLNWLTFPKIFNRILFTSL